MIVEPLGGQAKLAVSLATARWNLWEGAVRSSKTVSSLLAWLRFVREGPPGPLLMVGRTERTLKRNVIDTLIEMLGPQRCRLVAGSGELWLLGRRVYLVGANDEVAAEKIRGLTLAGAYVDEASTIPESFWAMLATRLSVPGARAFATSNPDGPRHWLKVNYLDRAKLTVRDGVVAQSRREDTIDLHRFRFRLADNPTLTPEYVAALDAEFTGLWRARLIDGEWTLASGVVFEMFDEARHVVEELPEIAALISVGIDYGATNPSTAVMLALARDGRLVVTREYRHDPSRTLQAKTIAQVSAELKLWLAGDEPRMIAVDPAAKVLKDQLRADHFRRVQDADNRVIDGIRTLSSLFAADRLVVHSSCTGLLDELPNYSWDERAAARGDDKPMKVNDHSTDALRYAVLTSTSWWKDNPVSIKSAARGRPPAGPARSRVPAMTARTYGR